MTYNFVKKRAATAKVVIVQHIATVAIAAASNVSGLTKLGVTPGGGAEAGISSNERW